MRFAVTLNLNRQLHRRLHNAQWIYRTISSAERRLQLPDDGALYLGGNALYLDSIAYTSGDGNGNSYFQGATAQVYLTSTDANADTNNNNAGFQILNNWTLSGSNASTDLLVNRTVASGSSTGTQLLADFQIQWDERVPC